MPTADATSCIRVLIVDRDVDSALALTRHLLDEGYAAATLDPGLVNSASVSSWEPDAVVVKDAGAAGTALCATLRRDLQATLLLVCADEESEVLAAFNAGADAVVRRSVGPHEVVARLRAAVRRRTMGRPRESLVAIGNTGLSLERDSQSIIRDGKRIRLRPKEYELLTLLLLAPFRVVNRHVVASTLWPPDQFPDNRTIDTHVRHLRNKIETDPTRPRIIRTIRGVGFFLELYPDGDDRIDLTDEPADVRATESLDVRDSLEAV